MLFIILLRVYTGNHLEGFTVSVIPEYCKTAGVTFADETLIGMKMFLQEKPTTRIYTESECAKLENSTFDTNNCYQLKNNTKKLNRYDLTDNNIIINYGKDCVDLNKTGSNTPLECIVDGQVLGKPFVGFKYLSVDDKQVKTLPNNMLQVYTVDECKQLKGIFVDIPKLLNDSQASKDTIDTYIKKNGKDRGICRASNYTYSTMCNNKPSSLVTKSDVIDLTHSIKDILNS